LKNQKISISKKLRKKIMIDATRPNGIALVFFFGFFFG